MLILLFLNVWQRVWYPQRKCWQNVCVCVCASGGCACLLCGIAIRLLCLCVHKTWTFLPHPTPLQPTGNWSWKRSACVCWTARKVMRLLCLCVHKNMNVFTPPHPTPPHPTPPHWRFLTSTFMLCGRRVWTSHFWTSTFMLRDSRGGTW